MEEESTSEGEGGAQEVRADTDRRMDAPLKRVNLSGWICEEIMTPLKRFSTKIGSNGGQENGLPAGD